MTINRQEWLDGLKVGDMVLYDGKPSKLLGIQDTPEGRRYFVEGCQVWLRCIIDPIVTKPFDPAGELYRLASEQVIRWGGLKSIKSIWIHNVRSALYSITCKMAGVGSVSPGMSDSEILPTIFSGEDLSLLDGVILNEYNFWKVAAEYSICGSLPKAISNVRANNTISFTPRLKALNMGVEPVETGEIVLLTAIGCLLYDFDAKSYMPNPLWYSKQEWEKDKN